MHAEDFVANSGIAESPTAIYCRATRKKFDNSIFSFKIYVNYKKKEFVWAHLHWLLVFFHYSAVLLVEHSVLDELVRFLVFLQLFLVQFLQNEVKPEKSE